MGVLGPNNIPTKNQFQVLNKKFNCQLNSVLNRFDKKVLGPIVSKKSYSINVTIFSHSFGVQDSYIFTEMLDVIEKISEPEDVKFTIRYVDKGREKENY